MTPVLLRRLALASLVANLVIVITGGAVRLTGSGLGCDTWPRCTDDSYVPTSEMSVHTAIEFGNRMLGGLVGLVVLATLVAVLRERPRRRGLLWTAALVLVGVAAQGLIGGITVRTGLNPWIVAPHFLSSMALLAASYALWHRTGQPDLPARRLVPQPVAGLAAVLIAASGLVLVLGTVVTGSGPHAGDPDAGRMGFDIETVAQLHTDVVFLLVGLSVAMWFLLRAVRAPRMAVRAAAVLVAVELAQGTIGFVQYFTHLPVALVAAHLAGACAVWLATLAIWPALHTRVTPGTGPAPAEDADRLALSAARA